MYKKLISAVVVSLVSISISQAMAYDDVGLLNKIKCNELQPDPDLADPEQFTYINYPFNIEEPYKVNIRWSETSVNDLEIYSATEHASSVWNEQAKSNSFRYEGPIYKLSDPLSTYLEYKDEPDCLSKNMNHSIVQFVDRDEYIDVLDGTLGTGGTSTNGIALPICGQKRFFIVIPSNYAIQDDNYTTWGYSDIFISGQDIAATLIHEFGHTYNFAHPVDIDISSVMQPTSIGFFDSMFGSIDKYSYRELWAYDQICLKIINGSLRTNISELNTLSFESLVSSSNAGWNLNSVGGSAVNKEGGAGMVTQDFDDLDSSNDFTVFTESTGLYKNFGSSLENSNNSYNGFLTIEPSNSPNFDLIGEMYYGAINTTPVAVFHRDIISNYSELEIKHITYHNSSYDCLTQDQLCAYSDTNTVRQSHKLVNTFTTGNRYSDHERGILRYCLNEEKEVECSESESLPVKTAHRIGVSYTLSDDGEEKSVHIWTNHSRSTSGTPSGKVFISSGKVYSTGGNVFITRPTELPISSKFAPSIACKPDEFCLIAYVPKSSNSENRIEFLVLNVQSDGYLDVDNIESLEFEIPGVSQTTSQPISIGYVSTDILLDNGDYGLDRDFFHVAYRSNKKGQRLIQLDWRYPFTNSSWDENIYTEELYSSIGPVSMSEGSYFEDNVSYSPGFFGTIMTFWQLQ